jgi:hypothetical protein
MKSAENVRGLPFAKGADSRRCANSPGRRNAPADKLRKEIQAAFAKDTGETDDGGHKLNQGRALLLKVIHLAESGLTGTAVEAGVALNALKLLWSYGYGQPVQPLANDPDNPLGPASVLYLPISAQAIIMQAQGKAVGEPAERLVDAPEASS